MQKNVKKAKGELQKKIAMEENKRYVVIKHLNKSRQLQTWGEGDLTPPA
jgi:hypothetical protein